MLINTVPNDCLIYICFNLFFFNITSIVNVFMLIIQKKTDLINHSIESFDWSKLFSGKNVHEQVELFNKTLLNIFYNFIPTKTIV